MWNGGGGAGKALYIELIKFWHKSEVVDRIGILNQYHTFDFNILTENNQGRT